jgi:hypothetical protein
MSSPSPESRSPRFDKPKPEDLAGIPACLEEDNPRLGTQESQDPQVVMHPTVLVGGSLPGWRANRPPTADDLAGIPVCAEGDEDLTVRPRKPHQQQ